MAELGYKGVGTVAWNGMFAPADTPQPVLQKIHDLAVKALNAPEVREKLLKQNFEITPNKSLADAKAWLAGEIAHWKTITEAVKIETH
jgi:tripartite-type tricarboxylate transporter receptor subunit TctC